MHGFHDPTVAPQRAALAPLAASCAGEIGGTRLTMIIIGTGVWAI